MIFTENNNKGVANEIKFANILDKKTVKELPKNYQEMLYSLFEYLKEDDYIECWKSKFKEKADIKVRINNNIKGISIKMGELNSVHQEHINSFSNYLLNIGISPKIITELREYIIGIMNRITMDAKNYKKSKPLEILKIKKSLSDFYTKANLIIRFLFKGNEKQFYDADAIIHGTPNNFIWATKSEILKYLLEYPEDNSINVKVGPLFIQCRNRNLNDNISSRYAEEYIQVKWYSIRKDLYFITKKREEHQNISINDKKER